MRAWRSIRWRGEGGRYRVAGKGRMGSEVADDDSVLRETNG